MEMKHRSDKNAKNINEILYHCHCFKYISRHLIYTNEDYCFDTYDSACTFVDFHTSQCYTIDNVFL